MHHSEKTFYRLDDCIRQNNDNSLYNIFCYYDTGHEEKAGELLVQLYDSKRSNISDRYRVRALFLLTKITKRVSYAVECFQNARVFDFLSDTEQGELLLRITQTSIAKHKNLSNTDELKKLAKYLIAFLKTQYFKTSLGQDFQKSYITIILTNLKLLTVQALHHPELQNVGYDLLQAARSLPNAKNTHAKLMSSVEQFHFKCPLHRVSKRYKKIKRLDPAPKRPVLKRQDGIRLK